MTLKLLSYTAYIHQGNRRGQGESDCLLKTKHSEREFILDYAM